MRYKAIIMDVDGTCVPSSLAGLPSQKVLAAIQAAQKKIHVSVCTSRPIFIAKNVIRALGISDPCGINDATQIYDPKQEQIIENFYLSPQAVTDIITFFNEKKLRFMVNNGVDEKYYDGNVLQNLCSIVLSEVS